MAFLQLGFRHITDPGGLDHVLFLVSLIAIYRWHDWRRLIWVASAFTLGHSITLALTVTGLLRIPASVIEFLIPITIVATGIENIIIARRTAGVQAPAPLHRPLFAAVFGLVHGAGFANYLTALFVEDLAIPLIGFNLGLEAGQLIVLAGAGLLLSLLDGLLTVGRPSASGASAFRFRVVAVSSVVAIIAAGWAAERAPW